MQEAYRPPCSKCSEAGGVPTLVGGYLPWMRVPTLVGGTYLGVTPILTWLGVTYLGWGGTYLGVLHPDLAGGYLPWMGDTYLRVPLLPDLTGGYLPWMGVPTLDGGYLPWMGGRSEM